MQRNASWDDWLMLAAAFPMSALAVICPLVIEIYRFDRHAWDVEDKYFPIQRKFVMAIYILYSLASGMIKLSVLLFYRRLSARAVSPAFRWIMRTSIVVIGGYSIAFCVIPIFACRPISAFWDQVDFAKLAQGYKWTCINEGADIVAHGIASTTQDLIVAFLPTMLFWNLQMPRRQKIALYSIFALGYTTVPLGAMRTYRSYQLFFTTYDVTWVGFDIWIWSLLELHIGAMCANAPALKIFFEKVLEVDRLTSWTRSRSRSQSQGSKKQNSRKDSAASAGALRQPEGRHWFKRVVRSSDSDGARGTTLQMDPRVNSGFAASRDNAGIFETKIWKTTSAVASAYKLEH
ncbi:hypothetical protein N0V86_000201 [Didymella sp. IMI 355093]|nr:hypothetical protein N0V86_000201 [Didymella sp. IMI 355093]